MRRPTIQIAVLSSVAGLFLAGCGSGKTIQNAGAPPPLKVEACGGSERLSSRPSRAVSADGGGRACADLAIDGDRHRQSGRIQNRAGYFAGDGPRRGDQGALGRHS